MAEDSRRIRVLAIVEDPPTIWERWRLVAPYWRLRQLGYDVRTGALDADEGIDVRRGEVVVLPRMTVGPDGHAAAEQWLAALREQASAVVYETDDDLFSEGFVEHIVSSRWQQGMSVAELEAQRQANRWFVAQCDGVTVSSPGLAEIVRELTDKPVLVVPNTLDVRWFRAALPPRAPWADTLTIGWAGGRRPPRDLEPMAESWGRIAARYPDVQFVVASPSRPDVILQYVERDRVIALNWLPFDQYPLAHMVDIGCCAVADTPFSRCKTPIKAWEYAAAGAAVVATRTLYRDCVRGNGLLVSTADEWEHALMHMIETGADHRQKHAARLREHVEANHNLDTELHRWTDAYRAIVDARTGVLA